REPLKSIEVYLGNNIAPGSFAWVVPVNSTRARIGLSTKKDSMKYLSNLISNTPLSDKIKDKKPILRKRIVPISPIDRTYFDRLLVVGDSAGQVKPITGGGIFYGLLCASAASETIISAFKKKDFRSRCMRGYETKWKKLIGLELKAGSFVRKFMGSLNDDNMEGLVATFKKDQKIKNILQKSHAFDWHKDVIMHLLKTPSLSGRIYQKLLWNIFNKNGFEKSEDVWYS
ncbi:MAG: NAD(P)/FAD-dependent oxidoreductase, partial [Candidatus Omnitrophica bacterium]|nr:NAD(P)/FAD-dependent oxidoreductase [Candidatus Omnitrophota bacterium]